jgi:prepilin-type N-terminal cleavage/methylation domain-containing protein
MKNFKHKLTNQGFTIIELLIATVIFSIVLLVLTQTIISLTNTYYHGVIQTQTYQTVKNINNDIVGQLQFGVGNILSQSNQPEDWPPNSSDNITSSSSWTDPNLPEGYICIGDNEYIYQLGGEVGVDASHALILTSDSGCLSNGPQHSINDSDLSFGNNSIDVTYGSKYLDLIPNKMRLVKLLVAKVPNFQQLYIVDVKVAYGDDGTGTGSGYNTTTQECYANSIYCATSELVTYVEVK